MEDKVLGSFIYHKGRYWLVKKYDPELYGGGFFAVPIYFNEENRAELRPAISNWCYKIHGVIMRNPELEVQVDAYNSQLKHLKWKRDILRQFTDTENLDEHEKKELQKIDEEVDYFEGLLAQYA